MGHLEDNGKDNVSFYVKDNGQDKANGHLFMGHVEAGQQSFLPVHLNPLSVSSVRLQQT